MKDILFGVAIASGGASGAILLLLCAGAEPTLGLGLWYALFAMKLLAGVGVMERKEPRK